MRRALHRATLPVREPAAVNTFFHRFGWVLLVPCGWLASHHGAIADENIAPPAGQITSALQQPIISVETSLNEVQQFCEDRVPLLPIANDAAAWQATSDRLRQRTLDEVVFRGEAQAWRQGETRVEWFETIDGGEGYRIRKLRYEALPGVWIPALLYEPDKLDGKVPAVMNVNGHDGKGKAAGYKQIRCINLAKRGMLALNVEWFGMGQLRSPGFGHYRMNQLDLCGTSGIAPFYLAMQRGLDVLLAHQHADPERVAVAGLSGGGWQTIFISSLDTRVKLANPVAGYSSFLTRARHFSDLGDSEQTPCDLATVVDYSHLTAMMAPRSLLLTKNLKDNCCFASPHALPPLLEASRPVYALLNVSDRLRWHVNEDPGNHNFERDNREAFYRMLRDQFYDGDDKACPGKEIASGDEVKTSEELAVPLPEENLDFSQLATRLAEKLPRNKTLPQSQTAAEAWKQTQAAELSKVLRTPRYEVAAESAGVEKQNAASIQRWKLKLGDAWTVPAVEFVPANAKRTVLVFSEQGRAKLGEQVAELLSQNARVIAFDPFYFGESKIQQKDFLFGLLVAAVGERPLGIQTQQVAAIARWARTTGGTAAANLELQAVGPRSSLIALAAAAIETAAIDRLQLTGSYGSLREVIGQELGVNQAPELFCFGLLQTTDVLQMAALVAPRPIRFEDCSEEARAALAPLAGYYQTLGSQFKPLP